MNAEVGMRNVEVGMRNLGFRCQVSESHRASSIQNQALSIKTPNTNPEIRDTKGAQGETN